MNLKILHLSDLHISTHEEQDHKMLRGNILSYVKEHIQGVDVVAFTGDLIDRADSGAFELGADFLKELCKGIGVELDHLVIVAGNHDMERTEYVNKTLELILTPGNRDLDTEEFCDKGWRYIAPRMESYTSFMLDMGGAPNTSELYGIGVKVIEKDGYKICFNMLNSSWANQGKGDYRNLLLGKWQLEMNRKQIGAVPDRELVITLMHHPVSWLKDEEADMLRDYMRNEDKLDSPIILHGHMLRAA